MLEAASVVGGVIVLVAGGVWVLRRVRGGTRSAAQRESHKRHRDAQQREPPVDLGDVREVAVHEFTDHHSGERQAVCKIEGFVVFVEDIPAGLEVGDVLEIKVLSFNRGQTSATATFLGRA